MNSNKLIIWDWIGTLVNRQGIPFEESEEMLSILSGAYKQTLVSQSSNPNKRLAQIAKTSLRKYFDDVTTTKQKTLDIYQEIIETHKYTPKNTWLIDDRTRRGIQIGNQLGCKTIWLARPNGEYLHETPYQETGQPTHKVSSLTELTGILLL